MQVFVLGRQRKHMKREHNEGVTRTGGGICGMAQQVCGGEQESEVTQIGFPLPCHPCRLTMICNFELCQLEVPLRKKISGQPVRVEISVWI